jgi:flotillin
MQASTETTKRAPATWRTGKPVEDPEKTKRWGFVTAKPSEYLVHVRRGKVLQKSSGQGASCFKWPWDAVAIIPTSLQRLSFSADQVTAEKVGVEVVGLAVYRIAEPLLAYRVLNFSYPERAQQKLEETLTGMFVGATRRLVANLSVDDCLRKRKSALAEELIREIAPVVGGNGRPDDFTTQGWGVVIDTIEIQEVKILSEKVFASLQAPYRTEIDQRARQAKAKAELEAIELDREQRARKTEAHQALAEREIAQEAALRQKRREAERSDAEAQAELAARRVELSAFEARAVLEQREIEAERSAHQEEVERARAIFAAEIQKLQAEASRHAAEIELELDRKRAEIGRLRAEAEARTVLASKLPEFASALGQRIGGVQIHQIGGGEDPFSTVLKGVHAAIATAKSLSESA